MRSRSCTSSTYARLAAPTRCRSSADSTSGRNALGERLLRRIDDRHLDAERLLRPPHGLVVEERDDRLAERHRLDREDAVPARVQLVDDHVRVPVALERLAMVEPLDDLELDVELARTRRRHAPCPLRARDDGACSTTGRSRSRRRRGLDRAHVDPRRDHLRVRHPADRVVGADDARARALRPRELAPAACRGCRSRESA